MTALLLLAPLILHAQDTTQAYPWRFSNFPYITASPNDGVMLMYRGVFFRQSRWDDRTSIDKQVALEGGYSTKDAWLVRARGDFPRLGDGWRLQLLAQAAAEPNYDAVLAVHREVVSAEVSRALANRVYLSALGRLVHLAPDGDSIAATSPFTARLALVIDERDREYDTRSGLLAQFGVFAESGNSGHGGFGQLSGWLPVSETTRLTARIGIQSSTQADVEGKRTMLAWEDDYVLGGGPQSNRGLPIGASLDKVNAVASAEVRHDIKVFPGGAVGVLAFIDASRADCGGCIHLIDTPIVNDHSWTVSPGVGLSLRLLRNAILTGTIARAEGSTRVYVSSGWSW